MLLGFYYFLYTVLYTGIRGRATVSRVTGSTACHRRDDAIGGHLADDIVSKIGNIKIAGSIHSHLGWPIKAGIRGCGAGARRLQGRAIINWQSAEADL
jgi:hypothetical protein